MVLQQFGWRQVQVHGLTRNGRQRCDFRCGSQEIVWNVQRTGEAGHVDQASAECRVGIQWGLCAVELAAGIKQQHMQAGFARQDALAGEIELRLGNFVGRIAW